MELKSTPKITKLDLTQAQEAPIKVKQKKKMPFKNGETNAGNVHVKEQKDRSGVQQVDKEVRSSVENVTEEQEVDSPLQLISDEETNINESGSGRKH